MTASNIHNTLSYHCHHFTLLTSEDLYEIIQLREKIFVVEQSCAYLDCDGRDISSYHLCGILDDKLIAYSRLNPAGVSYNNFASIGRILVAEEYRGKGYGREIVINAIHQCHELFPDHKIKISAQSYLKEFYQTFGFSATGDEYLEDGIPHLGMILCVRKI